MNNGGWTNRAHAGAYKRGQRDAEAGKPRNACPYRRHPGGGVLNGSFAFGNAWRDGWDRWHKENPNPACSAIDTPAIGE